MIFKCKVCIEKDKMIAELSNQVAILRNLAYPNHTSNEKAFMQSIEANKLLDGDISNQIYLEPSTQPNDFHTHWS